jgi:hypothetical protein
MVNSFRLMWFVEETMGHGLSGENFHVGGGGYKTVDRSARVADPGRIPIG